MPPRPADAAVADLGHRELAVLRSLHGQLAGVATAPCCLTPAEYTSAVLSAWPGASPLVERVWLTADGRAAVGG